MREIFVSELVREMLGPRRGVNGIRETLDRSPMAEFMTGILSPIMAGDVDPDRESTIPDAPIGQSTRGEEDSAAPDEEGVFTVPSPSLDPGKIPSTMGISFRVESGEKINLKICITWARYLSEQPHAISCNREERLTFGSQRRDSRRWTRQPRSVIVDDVMKIIKKPAYIDSDGNLSDSQNGAEISLHAYARPRGNGKYFVSMYIVNGIQVPCSCSHAPEDHDNANSGIHPCTQCDECITYKGRAGPEHHIFQPQIRVIAPTDHTKIIEGEDAESVGDDELEFLYRNRRYRARGHLTSAVWKDVDPESQNNRPNVDYQECADDIPFAWTDGELLSQQDRKSFTTPDVRTDYVPLYSIAAPELEWKKEYGPAPELDAEELAKICKPDELRKALLPLCDGYEKWIDEQRQNIVQEKRQLCDRLIGECETVLERIKLGIETVCDKTNPDATLAFCFANKAIDLQFKWARDQQFRYRPFQLAYILMCIESIVNKKSEYRDSCDLMWVPTGTGKTEAYLALAVFTMAYRRRLALREEGEPTGAGVSIITRYTLRLLTTQQFRRTLSVVTAAEFLRTHSLSNRSRIGWRPEAWPDDENFIWGSSQFSTGLWIGAGVAPNKLRGNDQFGAGAIEILQGNPGMSSYGKAEPAQVVECPCCRANLSITDNGLSGSADMHLVVMTDATNISNNVGNLASRQFYGLNITRADSVQHTNSRYHTISLTVDHGQDNITSDEMDGMWRDVEQALDQAGTPVTLVPFRASRPGYFPRQYIHNNNPIIYDFEIFCPNPECPLHLDKDTSNNVQWFRGSPTGSIHNKSVDTHQSERVLNTLQLTDGNALDDVQDAFQENSEYVADRIPIPALVIDDQVYQRIPTIVVSTVDKFARPAFEPKASSLFGNVNRYHKIHGYYNTDWLSGNGSDLENPSPRTGGTIQTVTPLGRPDLILQDELHLIDGPLGSMVGIYETAVDFLCSNENNVKYIASTATIKKADEHVRSLFNRTLQTFPPHGLLANDRFFVSDEERHQLADDSAGRLYLGISAPGKGGLMPIIRTWARLAQTAWEHRADNIQNLEEKLDPFWTLTGYFNANRELAGALGTYSQDIRMRIQQLAEFSPHGERVMDDSRCYELSGRTSKAADLPKILQVLGTQYPNNSCADSLFTTSMFGTGVDISRLGLMLINGEPKTTSSYIQSSGRVGRKSGGLIIASISSDITDSFTDL